ncbi:AsmA family protein [Maridesulfovibrio ferrireducens]|uniref:AsmA family protein n=1 Tax=Maridesulfovibrio ferrireducens TaxID=246191 RepID=UPI001A22C769|nr:AsmA family protein [Maridesulfovibrio ferrireducens]MBI9111934.1 AsmA family protein [Maridesulfovibrio ferrireducens]
MSFFRAIRILLLTGLSLVVLTVLSVAAILFFEIPVDATLLKPSLEKVSSYALGRKVTFGGELKFVTSLSPAIEVADVTIANPPGFSDKNFAVLKFARLHVNALKLLAAKIEIHELTVEGIRLNLESKQDGSVNWDMEIKGTGATDHLKIEPESADLKSAKNHLELTSDSLSIQKILFKDIQVTEIVPGLRSEYRIDECNGAGRAGEPFYLDFKGIIGAHPYTIGVKVGSLSEFLATQKSWAEINGEIARTQFALTGEVQLPSSTGFANLSVSVKGENLTTLNSLLKVDLPPFKNYGIICELNARKGKASLRKLDVRVGESRLVGSGSLSNYIAKVPGTKAKPDIKTQLTAELIQLDDFNLDGWSPSGGSQDEPSVNATSKIDVEVDSGSEVRHLLSPELMNSLDAQFKFEAKEVKKGKSSLGRGVLAITLKNGVLSIDPLDLYIPGGAAHFDGTFAITTQGVNAGINALIDKFDYGIIAREAKPDTDMGGLISLDISLKSEAPDFNSIMEYANGHFRIGAKPQNLESGIIDLWAVNLFTAVMDSVEKEKSKINCAILQMGIKNGMMDSESIVVDTSKMRIFGKAAIDFKKRNIDLEAAPTPKRPEFFNLATPVAVHGTFKDFGIKLSALNLVGTVVSFVVSPVVVPIERIFVKDLPVDGSDVCFMDFTKQESFSDNMKNATAQPRRVIKKKGKVK